MSVLVTKADGEQEFFQEDKLDASLVRAGASASARRSIISHIRSELHDGMTTEAIYHHAFELLKKADELPVAARYSVKRAVFALGPSGYPFERFFAAILNAHGWTTRTGLALTGRCAPHEVDILAEKNGKRVGVEAKFHNDPGGRTDMKDALYVYARYEDLKQAPDSHSRVDEGWLVTNTRFTRNVIRYAQCANLTIISWDYPRDHGLHELIEKARVHPLTCLTSLTDGEKRSLLERNIVLCKDVRVPGVLQEHGVRPSHIDRILEEAARLCTPFVDTHERRATISS
jgi:hypothetical protein